MSIQSIEDAKALREQGKRLRREGLAERALALLCQYKDPSYFDVMDLIGRFHALSLASRFDQYWEEKTRIGFERELWDLQKFEYTREEKDEK